MLLLSSPFSAFGPFSCLLSRFLLIFKLVFMEKKPPEGRPGFSDVYPLSGISGLSGLIPLFYILFVLLPSPVALSVLSISTLPTSFSLNFLRPDITVMVGWA